MELIQNCRIFRDVVAGKAMIEGSWGAAFLDGLGPAAEGTVSPLAGLTPREIEVLQLVAAGNSNSEIGSALFISTKTASVHVSNILAKLGVSGRGEAAALAYRLGLVSV